MSRRTPIRKAQTASPDPERSQPTAQSRSHGREVLDRLLLFILLALIPLRTVAAETHTFELPRWLRLLEAPTGVGPATTFALFAIILAVATIILCTRVRAKGPYRWTGLEAGIGLFVLAAAVSTLRAGQKHLALAGSLDLLGLLLYAVALRQELTRPWHLRLALTVILATGAVVLTKCVHQRFSELPATIEYYQQHKSELTSRTAEESDASLRAGALYDYEQRLKAMSASGYVRHPNVLAGYLILVTMTSLAVAAGRIQDCRRLAAMPPLLLAAVAGATFVWAQSKGAAAAGVSAGVLWLLGAWWTRRRPNVRRSRFVIAFWAAAAIGAVSLVALLRAEPDALGRSMLFRSMYWQGAWRMLVAEGPWGVGADNFGRSFTKYKPVECPEDVDDPHSWPVKAACEHGVIGLAAMLLVFVGFSWRLARRNFGRSDDVEDHTRASVEPPGRSIILWMGGLGAALFIWWLWLCTGADANYAIYTLMLVVAPWFVGFVALAMEGAGETRFSDQGATVAAGGICAGLIGFLLHAGIDLTLSSPGASTTFFALMAVAAAIRTGPSAGIASPSQLATASRPWRPEVQAKESGDRSCSLAGASSSPRRPRGGVSRVVLGIVAAMGIAAVSLLLAYPSARLTALLDAARRDAGSSAAMARGPSGNSSAYRAAADCYPLDATALGEWIEELHKQVSKPTEVDFPLSLSEEFHRRDPLNSAYWHYVAGLYWARFRLARDAADMREAVDAMRETVAAYPTSPSRRLRLADLLQELAEADGAAETRHAAAVELQTALDLDAKRVYVSEPNRLTEEQRTAIMTRILELRQ
jgi:hypothetical protein